jgi:hypothetical protein
MNIEDQIFQKSYDETLAVLELKSQDESFEISNVHGELNTLYSYEGLDWIGRGEIKNSEISGAIAAYQVFINKFDKAQKTRDSQAT